MATSVLETLQVVLRAEDIQFRRALDNAERQAAGSSRNIRRSLDFGDIGGNLGGLVGSGGLLYGLRETAQEAARTDAALLIFKKTLASSGQDSDAANAGIQRVANTLGLTTNQIVDSATQLLRYGYTMEQIEGVLIAGGSSALAFGRDAAAGVENVSQALITEQSVLLNTIGISENLGPALQKVTKDSAGLTEEQLKQAKAAAATNLVLNATKQEVDSLGVLLAGLPGSQAAVNREWVTLRNSIGGVVSEALIPLNGALADGIGWLNGLPDPVLKAGTAAVTAGAGVAALAAGVGTLALVLGPLVGPAGLLILAAAGAAAFITATSQAPTPIRTLETAVDDLKTAHEEYQTAVENASEAETLAAGKRLTNARDTAQVALDESRTRLSQAQAQLSAAEQAGSMNPEGFAAVAPTLAANVQAYERAVAEQETAIKLIDMRAAERLTSPRIRGGVVTGSSSVPANDAPLDDTTTDRTVTDIFTDLEKAGTASQQFAAALGTPEAKLADLEDRAALLEDALKEAFELGAGEDQLNYLLGRLEALTAEAETLNRELEGPRAQQGRPAPRSVIDAQLEEQASRAPEAIAAAENERNERRVRNAQVEAQNAQEAAVRVEALRERAVEAGGTFADRVGTAMGAYVTAFQTAAAKVGELSAKQDAVLAQLDRDAGAYTEPSFSPFGMGRQRVQGATPQSFIDAQTQYQESRVLGTGAVSLLNPDGQITGGGKTSGADFDEAGARITEAGEIFKEGVVNAGLDLASNLAGALADGKITGDEAAGIGGALGAAGGSILGNILLPGIGGQIGGILGGLAGNLFGGLFGSDEEDADSRAAKDMERRGGASQVSIILNFLQNNSFNGGLDQPSNAAELDRQGRKAQTALLDQVDYSRVKKKAGVA